jgi:transcriptional regulator of NAD metabolism
MPEAIKNKPNSKEFNSYLNSFMRRKERQHRHKVFGQAIKSLALIVTV